MRHDESLIQKIVVNEVGRKWPHVIFTCAPAVAKSARQGRENKLMGYRKGWPDLFFAVARGGYNGLFIELKTPRGKIQPEQEKMIVDLINAGYKAKICRSADEALEVIGGYLK